MEKYNYVNENEEYLRKLNLTYDMVKKTFQDETHFLLTCLFYKALK